MFLITTCQGQAIVLMKINKNINILKTNIPDLNVLSNLLNSSNMQKTPDFFLKGILKLDNFKTNNYSFVLMF